jgi:hypothetical protein
MDYQAKVYYEEIVEAGSIEEACEIILRDIRKLRNITVDIEPEPFVAGQMRGLVPVAGRSK